MEIWLQLTLAVVSVFLIGSKGGGHVLVLPAILLRRMLGNRIIKVGLMYMLTGRRREASGDNMCHRYDSGVWLSSPLILLADGLFCSSLKQCFSIYNSICLLHFTMRYFIGSVYPNSFTFQDMANLMLCRSLSQTMLVLISVQILKLFAKIMTSQLWLWQGV